MSATNKKRFGLPAAIAVVAIAAAGAVGLLAAKASAQPAVKQVDGAVSSEYVSAEGVNETITYGGKEYRLNKNLKTVLFLGIDQSEEVTAQDVLGQQGRSDTILLFVMDTESQTTRILEISRDTMIDVDIYGSSGQKVTSGIMQLTLQYSFGTSRKRSNWLMANKVSQLLYSVPIKYTLSLTMDGISPIVDALGGVTITVPKDYTAIDPAFVQGETVTLTGAQAERYVRTRDITVLGSNNDRMERQQQFMEALYRQMLQTGTASGLQTLQTAAEPYLESDLDADTLQKLKNYTLGDDIVKMPGETKEGEFHDEYYVDEDALRQLILEWFYQPVQ